MGKTLYLDCSCGISGDMFVAALLDAGANEARLRGTLATLPVSGFDVRVGRVTKAGLDCCDFDVVLDAVHENHDHDMAYLHGHAHDAAPGHNHTLGCAHGDEHTHDHVHEHDHAHEHDHEHTHVHAHGHDHVHAHDHDHVHIHDHSHEHRGLQDLVAIIEAAQLAPRARALALSMVDILAHAEAKAHGVPLDQVHFHEVGAVDSIVDIIAAAVVVDDLDIDRVIVPRLVDGRGTIRCQHGVIPVPVPATLNIVTQHNLPLSICEVEGELVTPTGAAIVAALHAEEALPQRFRVKRVGLGAGKRTYERPSILRALIIEESPADEAPSHPVISGAPQAEPTCGVDAPDCVVRLECDIDDATGEELAYAAERIRAAGAREVHWVPIFTKKERPAWQLQVVAAPADVEAVERTIFAETTTIGVRRWTCERTVLARNEDTVATAWGPVRVKRVALPTGEVRTKPEYHDLAAIAREHGISLRTVARSVLNADDAG